MAPAPRVIFDHRIFVSQVHGGISRYYANLAAALPTYGVAARIAAPLHINAYLGDLPAGVVGGYRLPAAHPRAVVLASKIGTALLPHAARRFRANVVHETYFAPRRLAPPGMKVALTVYDMIHEIFPEQWQSDPTAQYKARAVRDADLIFCISESTRRDLIDFYPEAAAKSVVTLLGFDPASQVSAGPPPSSGRPYILYVGQRAGYKNFLSLLRAFADSPRLRSDFDLVCVGGGAFSEDERAEIERLHLPERVRRVDAADRTLDELYRAATLFVYPSRYEGFGLPPLEAMAVGCPVAASNTSSIPEVCGDAAEYFDPADVGSLLAAVERALFEPGRLAALRAAGTRQLERFSWSTCADQTAEGYRGLVR